MNDMDILVIGGSGFVGGRLVQAGLSAGLRVAYTYAHSPLPLDARAYRMDLTQPGNVLEACLQDSRPRAIVHCAIAYAGDEQTHAHISLNSVQQIIASLTTLGLCETRLVYVSTNAVFTGFEGHPYREDEPPVERSDRYRNYGLYRARGEAAALTGWPKGTIIARTAHVEGRDTAGRLHWRMAEIVQALRAGRSLPRFVDRTISPTLVDNLAAALLELCAPDFAVRGILHLAGPDYLTDYAYARRIARHIGADEALVRPDRGLPVEETRPYNLSLDNRRAQAVLQTRLVGVDDLIALVDPGKN